MGLKGLMSSLGMDVFALVGLALFFCTFLGIVIWAYTRPRKEIERLSRLWEDDEDGERYS